MVYKMKLADISEIEAESDIFRPRSFVFTKMHGNGNDFILIDEMYHELLPELQVVAGDVHLGDGLHRLAFLEEPADDA